MEAGTADGKHHGLIAVSMQGRGQSIAYGVAPEISGVGPLVVAVGGTVSITGSHLAPAAGATTVQMGHRNVTLTSAADTTLQYMVPSDGASGFVTVQTPYGVASSDTSVFVLPSSISAASVASSGYATANGLGVTLNIGAGQMGVVRFDASQSPWISLQASNITSTASSTSYTVYGPGDVIVQQGWISPSSPSIHLPELLPGGSYVATFQLNSGSTQFTLSVETDAVLTTAAALSVTANAPGQSKRVVFNTSTAQNLEFTLNGVSVPGSSTPVSTQIYDPGGNAIVNTNNCYNTWICRYPIWNTGNGTYEAVIAPPDAGSTLAFNVLLQADVQGGGLVANTPVAVNLGVGQVARYTFTVDQGSNVTLSLSNVNTGNATWPMVVNVYGPAGVITTDNYYTTFSVFPGSDGNNGAGAINLPASGTYTVVIYSSGVPETAQLTFSSSPINSVPSNNIPSDGTNESESANLPGQNIYLHFSANQGDNLELTLNNVSISGTSSRTVAINVYDANGSNIASGSNCHNTWTCRYPLWNLSAGTYTVVISPPDARSTIGMDVMLEPDIQGGALSTTAPANINLGVGQVQRYTFAGVQGSNAVLRLSAVDTGNATWPLNVSVYSPNVGTVTPYNAYTTFNASGTNGSGTLNLANLPATGTYTVVVYTSGIPATGQLALYPNATNTLASDGTNGSYAASYPGQNIYLTFTASQGDNLELTLNNVSVTGNSASSVGFNVFDANGTNISSANNCWNTWVCRYALWNLTAGTYTVVISPPDTASTISTSVMLEPDVLGGSLSANTPVSINLGMGQVERFTFTASQGSNVTLNLSAVDTGSASWPVNVNLYAPNVGAITMSSYLATFSAPGNNGSNAISLTNLPAAGAYTLVIWTSGVPGTSQMTVVPQ